MKAKSSAKYAGLSDSPQGPKSGSFIVNIEVTCSVATLVALSTC